MCSTKLPSGCSYVIKTYLFVFLICVEWLGALITQTVFGSLDYLLHLRQSMPAKIAQRGNPLEQSFNANISS